MAWKRIVDAYQQIVDACPRIQISLEFKATHETTRYSFIPSTAAALLLVQEVDRINFGLTLDVGHLIMAGENPAQSVALASQHGKLFGVHLNDGHSKLGAEDGLMFGTVHASMCLELVWWLHHTAYSGFAPLSYSFCLFCHLAVCIFCKQVTSISIPFH